MEYIDLVMQEVGAPNMRDFFADGNNVAVTIRIPKNLRNSAKKEAELRGTSFSSLLRECLVDELTKGRK